jgi:hypothetical protein
LSSISPRARCTSALRLALLGEHVPTIALARHYMIVFAAVDRDLDRAAPHAQALLDLGVLHGLPSWHGFARFALAWAGRGHNPQALPEMRAALALQREMDFRTEQPLFGTLLAQAEAAAGELDAGLATVEEQLAAIEQTGERWFAAPAFEGFSPAPEFAEIEAAQQRRRRDSYSIKFRQRERRAQFEALRLLPLRDGDGGQELFLSRSSVRGIARQQNLAADAMGLRFEPTLPVTLGIGYRFVDGRECGVGSARLHFPCGQHGRKDRYVEPNSPFAARFKCGAHLRQTSLGISRLHPRPRVLKGAVCRKHRQLMCRRDVEQRFGVPCAAGRVPAHHLERRDVRMHIGQGADVTDLICSRQRLVDDPLRPFNFPQRPQDQRQVGHDGGADILGKTNDKTGIPFRIKHRERAFEFGARR